MCDQWYDVADDWVLMATPQEDRYSTQAKLKYLSYYMHMCVAWKDLNSYMHIQFCIYSSSNAVHFIKKHSLTSWLYCTVIQMLEVNVGCK